MRYVIPFLFFAMLAGCELNTKQQVASTPATETPPIQYSEESTSARDQAQRLWALINNDSPAKQAAFIDDALQNDRIFDEIFKPLRDEVNQAILFKEKSEFTRYKPCLDAAYALEQFASLRRKGGGQNDESDAFRRPYFDNRQLCEKALTS